MMMSSKLKRAVQSGRGNSGPNRLVILTLELPKPGRLGTSSRSEVLKPGLHITELELKNH